MKENYLKHQESEKSKSLLKIGKASLQFNKNKGN